MDGRAVLWLFFALSSLALKTRDRKIGQERLQKLGEPGGGSAVVHWIWYQQCQVQSLVLHSALAFLFFSLI